MPAYEAALEPYEQQGRYRLRVYNPPNPWRAIGNRELFVSWMKSINHVRLDSYCHKREPCRIVLHRYLTHSRE